MLYRSFGNNYSAISLIGLGEEGKKNKELCFRAFVTRASSDFAICAGTATSYQAKGRNPYRFVVNGFLPSPE